MEEKEERQSFQLEPDETEKPGVGESGEKEQGETGRKAKKKNPRSEVHRITEELRLAGSSKSSSGSYSRLPKTMSSLVLNICTDADSTASLGSLIQWSTTLMAKTGFLMFTLSFLCSCMG